MKPYRNRAYLDASAGQPCIRCKRQDDTTIPAHYSGFAAHYIGKGGGQKSFDLAIADLCQNCHAYFDGYELGNTVERSQEFLMLVLRTLHRRLQSGWEIKHSGERVLTFDGDD